MEKVEKLKQKFIEKAVLKFGEKFNYDNLEYKLASSEIKLNCPKHGEFITTPTQFLQSKHGCQKCAVENRSISSRKTNSQFIEEANKAHKNFYNYTNCNYINSEDKVIIICPIHGEFEQRPADHLRGHGCPKCKADKTSEFNKQTKRDNLDIFIEKANKIYNNYYDYSKVLYINSRTKICIICPKHGEFFQTPSDHLWKHGCNKCSEENLKKVTLTNEIFIQRASFIHNNRYDYSKIDFKGVREKICIICPEHGEFWQTPTNHIDNKQGCPICNYSKGELFIHDYLTKNNIKFVSQFKIEVPEIARNSNNIIIDFFVKHKRNQYFIEYDGIQHFEFNPHFHENGIIDFEKQQRRDRVLNNFCELHKDKVTLIRLSYELSFDQITNILNDEFK